MRTPFSAPAFVFCAAAISVGAFAKFGAPSARAAQKAAAADIDLARHGFGAPASPTAERLASDTGIVTLTATRPFRLPLANAPLEGAAPSPVETERASRIVARELARYPRALLQGAGLRRVVLARDLHEGSRPISSLPNVAGALIIDVALPEAFLARIVHHELFHFFDFADVERARENERWHRDNGLFAYGDGGRSMQSARASELSDEHPGFVSRYAMSAIEEDKAELHSFRMAQPADIEARAQRDPVVRSKLRQLDEKLRRLAPR